MQRGESDLPLNEAERQLEHARKMGAVAVQLTGGEPMVYPYLRQLVAAASARGMYSFFATSGTGHSLEAYRSLAEAGLSAVCLSLNDILEEEQKATRDHFALSLAALRDAAEAGIPAFINTVVTDANVGRLELLWAHIKRVGAVGMNLLRPHPSFDGAYQPRLSPETVTHLQRMVERNHPHWRVENCFVEYWSAVTGLPFRCTDVGRTTAMINADATVSPCARLMEFRYATVQEMLADQANWRKKCCDVQ